MAVTKITERQLSITDLTTGNVSTSAHGFVPKAPNDVAKYLDGVGGYNTMPDQYAAYALLGGAIKAEPLGGAMTNITTGIALADQLFRATVVYLPFATTITGVKWWQSIAGSYTASNYNGVGLYTILAGTMTLAASSTNDGNIWKAAQSMASKAFSSTIALSAGVYVIGFLYCRSAVVTEPTLGTYPNLGNSGATSGDFTNSVKLNSSLAAQTALPTPTRAMSTMAVSANQFYVALY